MTTVGRIRGRRTFAAIAAQGRTVRNGPLRVRFIAAPETEPQVGYAIGRSVGGAVLRNRVRRRVRAAVAQLNVPLTSGYYLISADATAATLPYGELVDALRTAVSRSQAGRR